MFRLALMIAVLCLGGFAFAENGSGGDPFSILLVIGTLVVLIGILVEKAKDGIKRLRGKEEEAMRRLDQGLPMSGRELGEDLREENGKVKSIWDTKIGEEDTERHQGAQCDTVYVLKSVITYHRAECFFRHSFAERISVEEAMNRGLKACRLCNPSQ